MVFSSNSKLRCLPIGKSSSVLLAFLEPCLAHCPFFAPSCPPSGETPSLMGSRPTVPHARLIESPVTPKAPPRRVVPRTFTPFLLPPVCIGVIIHYVPDFRTFRSFMAASRVIAAAVYESLAEDTKVPVGMRCLPRVPYAPKRLPQQPFRYITSLIANPSSLWEAWENFPRKTCAEAHLDRSSNRTLYRDDLLRMLRRFPNVVHLSLVPSVRTTTLALAAAKEKYEQVKRQLRAIELPPGADFEKLLEKKKPKKHFEIAFRMSDVIQCLNSSLMCAQIESLYVVYGGGQRMSVEMDILELDEDVLSAVRGLGKELVGMWNLRKLKIRTLVGTCHRPGKIVKAYVQDLREKILALRGVYPAVANQPWAEGRGGEGLFRSKSSLPFRHRARAFSDTMFPPNDDGPTLSTLSAHDPPSRDSIIPGMSSIVFDPVGELSVIAREMLREAEDEDEDEEEEEEEGEVGDGGYHRHRLAGMMIREEVVVIDNRFQEEEAAEGEKPTSFENEFEFEAADDLPAAGLNPSSLRSDDHGVNVIVVDDDREDEEEEDDVDSVDSDDDDSSSDSEFYSDQDEDEDEPPLESMCHPRVRPPTPIHNRETDLHFLQSLTSFNFHGTLESPGEFIQWFLDSVPNLICFVLLVRPHPVQSRPGRLNYRTRSGGSGTAYVDGNYRDWKPLMHRVPARLRKFKTNVACIIMDSVRRFLNEAPRLSYLSIVPCKWFGDRLERRTWKESYPFLKVLVLVDPPDCIVECLNFLLPRLPSLERLCVNVDADSSVHLRDFALTIRELHSVCSVPLRKVAFSRRWKSLASQKARSTLTPVALSNALSAILKCCLELEDLSIATPVLPESGKRQSLRPFPEHFPTVRSFSLRTFSDRVPALASINDTLLRYCWPSLPGCGDVALTACGLTPKSVRPLNLSLVSSLDVRHNPTLGVRGISLILSSADRLRKLNTDHSVRNFFKSGRVPKHAYLREWSSVGCRGLTLVSINNLLIRLTALNRLRVDEDAFGNRRERPPRRKVRLLEREYSNRQRGKFKIDSLYWLEW